MKIKKFNNLWTMGLIIFGIMLVAFYILKLVNPSFIVGIAEIPAVVRFGTYVDTHKWAGFLFYLATGYLGYYLFCCACCRKYKLTIKENVLILFFTISLYAVQNYLPEIYAPLNYALLILVPFIMLIIDNKLNRNTFISTSITFCVDIMAQCLSLCIRNIVLLTTCLNTATMTILLIDGVIWRILLYLYFNNKKEG